MDADGLKGRGRTAGMIASVVVVASSSAYGSEDLSGTLGYELEATSNATRVADDERWDLLHRPSLAVGYARESARTSVGLDSRLWGRIYQRGSFPDESGVTGRATGRVGLVPDRFEWHASVSRSETLRDARRADTPANRQETTSLATGGDLVLLDAEADRLTAGARLEKRVQSAGADDSRARTVEASYAHELAESQSLGLRGDWSYVDFDQARNPDYRRYRSLATYAREGNHHSLQLGVGYNWVDLEGSGMDGGLSLATEGAWVPASGHRLTFSMAREFTHRNPETLARGPDVRDLRQEDGNDGDVYEVTSGALAYDISKTRWRWGVRGSARRQDGALRDERRLAITVTAGYMLGRHLELNGRLTGERREFPDENRNDRRYLADAGLLWTLGRRTSASLNVGYDARESAVDGDFDEVSVAIGIRRQIF